MPESLLELVERHTRSGSNPHLGPVPGMALLRSDRPKDPTPLLFKPSLCVVLQGAKWTTFGGRRYEYGAGQALVVSVEMPALSRVVEASPSLPNLGAVLELDPTLTREAMQALPTPPKPASVNHGVFVSDFNGPLADCVHRLIRLLDTPQAVAYLAPLIKREIAYWLLAGPHGAQVATMVLGSDHTPRILRAIYALRSQFTKVVRVEELAAIAQLSTTAFHRQFKALTAMTPLQYQKHLRLLEARHLMVTGEANAEAAAYRVGYESPSQFSREYARLFGAPPRRDIAQLQTD